MKNIRSIRIILCIVILLGILVQLIRSEYLCKFETNSKDVYKANAETKVNSISQDQINSMAGETFLLLYSKDEVKSLKIADNIKKTLEYMKKDYIALEAKDFRKIDRDYSSVIIACEDLSQLGGLEEILSYTNNGGKTFFAVRPLDNGTFFNIYRKLGIYEFGALTSGKGIKLVSDVLLGGKGLSIDSEEVSNSFYPLTVKEDCRIHMTASNDVPMLWDVPHGSGRFAVLNGTLLENKSCRGLITGVLSLINEDFVYPIINFKLCFIDDFPSPIPKGYSEDIFKNYGRSIRNFYREVWWSDILKTAKNYNIKYNCMLVETYNDNVRPPFKYDGEMNIDDLVIYGKEIMKSGGEIGIHGFNHQPLVQSSFYTGKHNYKLWGSKEDMTASISETVRFVNSVFPQYKLKCYAPAANILDSTGREAVLNAMPDARVIASSYADRGSKDEYIQEYGVGSDGIAEMPRISSGYRNTASNMWNILNAATYLGVFSHYIEPHEALDSYKNGVEKWEELSKEYDELQKTIYKKYKWLRSVTVSEAASELEDFINCDVFLKHNKGSIDVYCNNFSESMYFILRTDKNVKVPKGCSAFSIGENAYLIHSQKAAFTISLGR